jgi:hypothetical protein
MFTLETRAHVAGLSARAAYDYMIVPPAHDFQAWWPGTHLVSKVLRRGVGPEGEPNDIGTVVYLEQMIGPFHVRETAEIVEAIPGRSFTRRIFVVGIRLPIFITFDLEDTANGVTIAHTIRAGWRGLPRILDPLFRLYFTKAFADALDEHLRLEYELLREVVKPAVETVAAAPRPATRPTVQLPALNLSMLPSSSGIVQN